MMRRKKYYIRWKMIGLAIAFQIFSFCVYSQCLSSAEIYTRIIAVENSDAAAPEKLKKILGLKKQFEDCKLVKDSVYARLLHRAGTLEYEANKNVLTASVINNTLNAARINTSASKIVSQKFAVQSYSNLVIYCINDNKFDDALTWSDSVIFYNQQYPDQISYTINALTEAAYIYAFKSDYQKCAETSTRGIAAAKEDNDSFNLTKTYYYRAKAYIHLANWKPANADIDSGFMYATLIQNNHLLANIIQLKALYYAEQNEYADAETNFEKDLQLRRKGGESELEDLITDYLAIGNYFLDNKSDNLKAVAYYNKGIQLCKSSQNSFQLSQLYTAIAAADFKFQHVKEAENNYYEAFKFLNVSAPENFLENAHTDKLFLVSNKDLLQVLFINKLDLLLTLYKETNNKKYLTSCLQTALVMDSVVTQTRHEMLGEQSKLYWRNKTRDFFSNAIEACYLKNNPEQAFYFMEKSRAVLLSDKLNELGADAHLSPAEAATQESLQKKIIETEQMLSAINPASNEYAEKQDSLSLIRDEQDNFIKLIKINHPAYYQYKYSDSVPPLQTLQQFLAKNHQSFIHYFMNDTVMYALGISANKTTLIKLTAKDFDSRQLAEFLNLCRNKFALNNHNDIYAAMAQNIYNKIFKPLHLPPGNVAICTDNFLIPFEALCTDSVGKNFLLYHYNFSYVYSARSLMKPFTGNAASRNFIGFAPVTFAQNLQVMPLNQSATALSKSAGFYNYTTLFTDQEATRRSFFSNASNYAVINIFSHAQADTSNQEPRLYMQDSVIYLSELQLLKNPSAQFVLLSACQTNIGKTATGEGIYSLARGFALAGIPAVSATLWNADERTVYEISGKFNEYLAAGMNKSEALQKAKIWFIKTNSSSDLTLPYYWANMVLIGSSQPIVLAKENYTWLWPAGTALVLFLITFAILLKRKRNLRINYK